MPRSPRRSRRPGRAPPRAAAVRVEVSPPGGTSRRTVELLEDPHAHIVCRVCGRIQRLTLNELDAHLLTELAAQHPAGWTVDGISFSLTGACRRCREGSGA